MPTGDDPSWQLLEERRLDPNRPSRRGDRRTSDFRASPSDSDASPRWDWGAIRLGYHDRYVVDGGKRRIILAALLTPLSPQDSPTVLDRAQAGDVAMPPPWSNPTPFQAVRMGRSPSPRKRTGGMLLA